MLPKHHIKSPIYIECKTHNFISKTTKERVHRNSLFNNGCSLLVETVFKNVSGSNRTRLQISLNLS